MTITNDDLVACAKRELAFRKRVYPRQVQLGKMTQEDADHALEANARILALLMECVQPSLL